MPQAADEVLAAIDGAGGTIRFDRFMELALYGEQGFYTSGGSAGRRGDFITSPEVGPLFGSVVARALDGWWHELGEPDPFTVVECGAGPGTLARSVLAARPDCAGALRYVAVERSEAQRANHPAAIESLAEMPEGPITGVVLANELLDNLPFRLLVFDGGWREAMVGRAGDRLVEHLVPFTAQPPWLPPAAPLGARVPLQDLAAAWVRSAQGLLAAGSVVAFDYMTDSTAELATMPWREWLRTYAAHQRGGHYLAAPGRVDITAQVALDQLPPPVSRPTQAEWLRIWGIDELVEEGRSSWQAAAGAPDLAALRMRSRIREAEALLADDGLGSFVAAEWSAGASDEAPAGGTVATQ